MHSVGCPSRLRQQSLGEGDGESKCETSHFKPVATQSYSVRASQPPEALWRELEGRSVSAEAANDLLKFLRVLRLIRHMQVLYEGMMTAGTQVYVKVRTTRSSSLFVPLQNQMLGDEQQAWGGAQQRKWGRL